MTYGEQLREKLQAQADEIGRRLGIALEVRAHHFSYDTRFRLYVGERALHNTWRSYSTMAYHLGTTFDILEASPLTGRPAEARA